MYILTFPVHREEINMKGLTLCSNNWLLLYEEGCVPNFEMFATEIAYYFC